ncbi:hypothetical protein LFZ32_04445 [Salmonella enterica subsp. enterica serovar Newport str. L0167]|nr:hypothetical protein LFZ32_04445 [Salmonella enterica subsp. enterica serovar Newport str. L0167]
MGGGSIYLTNREAPIKPQKLWMSKKTGKPYQINRVKIISCFLNVSGLARMSRN